MPELVAAVDSTSSRMTSTTVVTFALGTRLLSPGVFAVDAWGSVGMFAPAPLMAIQLPRWAGVNSQARKSITVFVFCGVIEESAFWEVTPHCPAPLGPPIRPTVEVAVASGAVSVVIGGSGKTPNLLVKPAEFSWGMYQLPPHSTPTLPWISSDSVLSGGVVAVGAEQAS